MMTSTYQLLNCPESSTSRSTDEDYNKNMECIISKRANDIDVLPVESIDYMIQCHMVQKNQKKINDGDGEFEACYEHKLQNEIKYIRHVFKNKETDDWKVATVSISITEVIEYSNSVIDHENFEILESSLKVDHNFKNETFVRISNWQRAGDYHSIIETPEYERKDKSKKRKTYQFIEMSNKWFMMTMMIISMLLLLTCTHLYVYIQHTELAVSCQPDQVDVMQLSTDYHHCGSTCACKDLIANECSRYWCYCRKCWKRVCLCCGAKDHHIHNHHVVVSVIEVSLKAGSCLVEFCFQGKIQWVPLHCYTTVLHVLHENAFYINKKAMHGTKLKRHNTHLSTHKNSRYTKHTHVESQGMQSLLSNTNLSHDIENDISTQEVGYSKKSYWPSKKNENKNIIASTDSQSVGSLLNILACNFTISLIADHDSHCLETIPLSGKHAAVQFWNNSMMNVTISFHMQSHSVVHMDENKTREKQKSPFKMCIFTGDHGNFGIKNIKKLQNVITTVILKSSNTKLHLYKFDSSDLREAQYKKTTHFIMLDCYHSVSNKTKESSVCSVLQSKTYSIVCLKIQNRKNSTLIPILLTVTMAGLKVDFILLAHFLDVSLELLHYCKGIDGSKKEFDYEKVTKLNIEAVLLFEQELEGKNIIAHSQGYYVNRMQINEKFVNWLTVWAFEGLASSATSLMHFQSPQFCQQSACSNNTSIHSQKRKQEKWYAILHENHKSKEEVISISDKRNYTAIKVHNECTIQNIASGWKCSNNGFPKILLKKSTSQQKYNRKGEANSATIVSQSINNSRVCLCHRYCDRILKKVFISDIYQHENITTLLLTHLSHYNESFSRQHICPIHEFCCSYANSSLEKESIIITVLRENLVTTKSEDVGEKIEEIEKSDNSTELDGMEVPKMGIESIQVLLVEADIGKFKEKYLNDEKYLNTSAIEHIAVNFGEFIAVNGSESMVHVKKFEPICFFFVKQQELVCMQQQNLFCLVKLELFILKQQEVISFTLDGSVFLKQQKSLTHNSLHILQYVTKDVKFANIHYDNVKVLNEIVCRMLKTVKLRNGLKHVLLCCLIIASSVLIGNINYIQDDYCDLPEVTVFEATDFDPRVVQHALCKMLFEKSKTRINMWMHYNALQLGKCNAMGLYALMHRNIQSAATALNSVAKPMEDADTMILHIDITKWSSYSIEPKCKFKVFQLHACFGYIQFSTQVAKAHVMAKRNTNAKVLNMNVQSQVLDVVNYESSCKLVASAANNLQYFRNSHDELVITRSSLLYLTMQCHSDVSRPVGKGSDPPVNHPDNHQLQKHFTSTETDGQSTSAMERQAAANTEFKKRQIGLNNDITSSTQGHSHLDHDVIPDGSMKCSSQHHKDNQLWITPEGFSSKDQSHKDNQPWITPEGFSSKDQSHKDNQLWITPEGFSTKDQNHKDNQPWITPEGFSSKDQSHKDNQPWITPEGFSSKDQSQLHTKIFPDCEVKHKFDATTSIITQDVVKDGKGAVDSSTLLQPSVTVGNSFAFNPTSVITQNVVKDGRGAVETKPSALLPSTSSGYNPLSAKIPAAQKTVVKSSMVHKGHDSGPQLIKALPTETDHLPPVGLQYNVLYDTNARDEVPMAQDEKSGSIAKQKVDKTMHRHYQKDFPRTTQHKNSAVKNDTSKTGVQKPLFPKRCCIVVGNKVFTLDPNLLAHPHMDTYFVKERTETRPGHFLARLVLHHVYLDKIHATNEDITAAQQSQAASIAAESEAEKDGGAVTERKHFPLNVNRAGYIVFSSDLTRFSGSMKYPLPSRKATAIKVGKGGNGFVFLIFHSGKEYAVKKTVYRANEIRIHSQLDHPNLLNLDAVLVGEEHERHRGKFYAFCFMPKCDMDLRSVISTKQHGCLKHLKMQLVEQRNIWEVVVVNIKYILKSLLKALEYMHNLGLVHRDVKASNILLKMKCPCTKPLMCSCPQKYVVKLGDFDSSTIVPGFGLKIEPHQMIRYASVLPLGTMGYRAPEVSMHLVISGPYEVLYTTAVDIWSFGCLLLNMLIGKNGPLKQRGEAALLLSAQEQPYSKELYHKIIKVNEVQKYYSDMPEFVDLVYKCLQVDVHCRPNARQLLQLDIMQNK